MPELRTVSLRCFNKQQEKYSAERKMCRGNRPVPLVQPDYSLMLLNLHKLNRAHLVPLPPSRPHHVFTLSSYFSDMNTTLYVKYMSCAEFNAQRMPSSIQDQNKNIEREQDIFPFDFSLTQPLAGLLDQRSPCHYDWPVG